MEAFFYPELKERGLYHHLNQKSLYIRLFPSSSLQENPGLMVNQTHINVYAQAPSHELQQPHDLLRVLGRLLQALASHTSSAEGSMRKYTEIIPEIPEISIPRVTDEASSYATRSHQIGMYFEGHTEVDSPFLRAFS